MAGPLNHDKPQLVENIITNDVQDLSRDVHEQTGIGLPAPIPPAPQYIIDNIVRTAPQSQPQSPADTKPTSK